MISFTHILVRLWRRDPDFRALVAAALVALLLESVIVRWFAPHLLNWASGQRSPLETDEQRSG